MKFRIQKIWVLDSRRYCAQIYNLDLETINQETPKKHATKCFLVISAHPEDFKVELLDLKPYSCKSSGFALEHLRRLILGGIISEIHRVENNLLYLVRLYQPQTSEDKYLVMSSRDGGNFEILNQKSESLLRFGAKGVFTKRKDSTFSVEAIKPQLNPFKLKIESQTQQGINRNSDIQTPENQVQSLEQVSILKKKLRRQIKYLKRSLCEHEKKLPSLEEIAQTRKYAELLKSHSEFFVPGMSELSLNANLENSLYVIPLNPKFSFGQNLDSYYHRLKKLQRAALLMRDHIEKIKSSLVELHSNLELLELGNASHDLIETLTLKLTKSKQIKYSKVSNAIEKEVKLASHQAYMTYLSETGVSIYVGKGSVDNDQLTKSARSEDFWLHAVNLSGAHVIISYREMKKLSELEKKKLFEEAKILAAHFSKAKLSYSAEIYITQKQYLKKPRRSAPGLWQVSQAKTEFVRYSEEDLQKILGRKLKK
ncbi:MAG: DUF814 domain-containing protein [Oligoflexales bacterium]|nr:DUF814 domain-containing protein [Oligoflexales bacterium]